MPTDVAEAVPELTRSADIKLNPRVSLRGALEILSSFAVVQDWPTPHTIRPCIPARLGVAAEAAAPPINATEPEIVPAVAD